MAAPSFISVTAVDSASPISAPTTQADDILLFLTRDSADASGAPTGGTYSGGAWTEVGHKFQGAKRGDVYWSRATGNHSGQTITWSNADQVAIAAYRDCRIGASPIGVNVSIFGSSAAGSTVDPASFDTTAHDVVVLLFAVHFSTADSWSSETVAGNAMAERLDSTGMMLSDIAQSAAGLTGAISATSSGSGVDRLAIAFALLPVGSEAAALAAASHRPHQGLLRSVRDSWERRRSGVLVPRLGWKGAV